jgi:adenosylcobinamide kinase / adenosylcobinamide-phosphate guanylyltransferase
VKRKSKFQNRKSEIVLITGGTRSGKSAYAEELAHAKARDSVLYLATAEALDDDMRARIAKHRAERPGAWLTLDAPRDLPGEIAQLDSAPQLIILDCVTRWVKNELAANPEIREHNLLGQLDLIMEWTHMHDIDLIIVSNEVGMGITPDNAQTRHFHDLMGHVNAYVAHHSDKVFFMVAGLPLSVKHTTRQ